MTIAMTPLEELDFPTPDLTEDWEASPEDVKGWFAYFEAEDQWHIDYRSWLEAETKVQNDWGRAEMKHWGDTYAKLQSEVMSLITQAPSAVMVTALDMMHPERCYCSPSRVMMMGGTSYDIYGGRGYRSPFEQPSHIGQTMQYQEQIANLQYIRDWVTDRITPAKPTYPAIAQAPLSDILVARRPVTTSRFKRVMWGQRG